MTRRAMTPGFLTTACVEQASQRENRQKATTVDEVDAEVDVQERVKAQQRTTGMHDGISVITPTLGTSVEPQHESLNKNEIRARRRQVLYRSSAAMTMTMTHSEKSDIRRMKAWPYRQECRGHDTTKKNLFC